MISYVNHLAALEHNAELRRRAEAGRLLAEARRSDQQRPRLISLRPVQRLTLRLRLKLA